METEVRFYHSQQFEGATRDAMGWYASLDFLPNALSDLLDHPEHEWVVIKQQVELDPKYEGADWLKEDNKRGNTAATYTNGELTVTSPEFGEASDLMNRILQAAAKGEDVPERDY